MVQPLTTVKTTCKEVIVVRKMFFEHFKFRNYVIKISTTTSLVSLATHSQSRLNSFQTAKTLFCIALPVLKLLTLLKSLVIKIVNTNDESFYYKAAFDVDPCTTLKQPHRRLKLKNNVFHLRRMKNVHKKRNKEQLYTELTNKQNCCDPASTYSFTIFN